MKKIKFLFVAICIVFAFSAMTQNFNSPQFAKWGATPVQREKNFQNNNLLIKHFNNHDYNAAAHYLKELIDNVPDVSVSIYQLGMKIYTSKIARAKSVEEKNVYVDSLLLIYDLNNQYFGDGGGVISANILQLKANTILTYQTGNRVAIRKAFREAIDAGGANSDPYVIFNYFNNLCNDYKNTNEVIADEVIAEYSRLSPMLATNPDADRFKQQFDITFDFSGAASCENLEKYFRAKLAAAPNDKAVLALAVKLMSHARCDGNYYFSLAEKHFELKPSLEMALLLVQALQNKSEYAKALIYLNEVLFLEKNHAARLKLLVRKALIEIDSNNIYGAASTARQAIDINPEEGTSYFVLAQCYATSASQCHGFASQTAMWAAYDAMRKAINLLPSDSEYLPSAKELLAAYHSKFPSSEELFFNNVSERQSYTVNCGTASGVVTTARAR